MVVSRKRPKGVRYYGPFGLSVLALSLMPRSTGYQDLAALMARQPEVSLRARAHMLASPFGTIHAATFSFPQPLGTLIPTPPAVQLASVAPADAEFTNSPGRDLTGVPRSLSPGLPGSASHRPRLDFPTVNRARKGDLLARPRRPEPPPPTGTRDLTPGRVKTVTFTRPGASEPPSGSSAETSYPAPVSALPQAEPPEPLQAEGAPPPVSGPPGERLPRAAPATESPSDAEVDAKSESKEERRSQAASYVLASLPSPESPDVAAAPLTDTIDSGSTAMRLGRYYFGGTDGEAIGPIQPWPIQTWPADAEPLPERDPDLKRSALATPDSPDFNFITPSATPVAPEAKSKDAGQSVAAKGEVTGPKQRPKTPAEKLGLDAKQRTRSEKCLAEAVYFESRGEPKRGQIAVAQVVMNRVFSGFYPNNVCGTVYQNANRKLACQFTFACDGIPDVVTEPDMWKQAKEIAHDMLDGKLWLPEIGHSTHYHAYWVHPAWVREMKKLYRIGVHSFYRPRAWGDTVEVPNYTFVPPKKG